MNKAAAVLTGIGVGAGLMYLFDPDRGPRRRALIRDKAVGLSHTVTDTVEGRAKDLRNRAKGFVHEAKGLVSNLEDKTDPSREQFS